MAKEKAPEFSPDPQWADGLKPDQQPEEEEEQIEPTSPEQGSEA